MTKVRPNPIEIPIGNPFKYDCLDREPSANYLTQLLANSKEPFVLCINGPWGSGKSTFLDMWMTKLSQLGYATVKFNAWENDHCEDALASLLAELREAITYFPLKAKKKASIKKKLNAVVSGSGALLKGAIPGVLKGITFGAFDLHGEIGKVVQEALSGSVEKFAEVRIAEYENAKSSISSFRALLGDFSSEVKASTENPLVIFIDELDRCRPNYAVSILEKSKHLFHVPGIIFVLGIDKEQMGHSIRSIYGNGMNVDGYIRRFMDYDYRLPSVSIEKYCASLFMRFEVGYFFDGRPDDRREAESTFIELAQLFSLTPRQMEHCFARFSIAIRTTEVKNLLYSIPLIFLIILREVYYKGYSDYLGRQSGVEELFDYLRSIAGWTSFSDKHLSYVLEAYLLLIRSTDTSTKSLIGQYKRDGGESRASKVYQIFTHLADGNFARSEQMLGYISNRIELAANFAF